MLYAVLLFRDALYGTLIFAITCGVLGVYVVLRRIIFVGAALAQLSSAGIAFALWLTGVGISFGFLTRPLTLALAVTLLGALFFGMGSGRRLLQPDATIGVTYAVAGALGIEFFKLVLERDPALKVRIRLHASTPRLLSHGYLGVLAAGGAKVGWWLLRNGVRNPKAAIDRLRGGK